MGFRSITTNKANGGDVIPAELFKILKDDAVKVLHSICQQIWKTQQWPSKESMCNTGDLGLILGSGRFPGEGNGYPLQYFCLGNLWTEKPGGLQFMTLQKSQT